MQRRDQNALQGRPVVAGLDAPLLEAGRLRLAPVVGLGPEGILDCDQCTCKCVRVTAQQLYNAGRAAAFTATRSWQECSMLCGGSQTTILEDVEGCMGAWNQKTRTVGGALAWRTCRRLTSVPCKWHRLVGAALVPPELPVLVRCIINALHQQVAAFDSAAICYIVPVRQRLPHRNPTRSTAICRAHKGQNPSCDIP